MMWLSKKLIKLSPPVITALSFSGITPLPSVLPLLGLESGNEERPIDSAQANNIQELSFFDKYRHKYKSSQKIQKANLFLDTI